MKLLPRLLYPLYEARLNRQIRDRARPKHVAVIVDGNRRWAREAGFTDPSHGHRIGAQKVGELVDWCADTDVEVVTVYLLSTENFSRSADEIELLFDIISGVVDELSTTHTGCRVRLVGHLDLLPEKFSRRMHEAAEKSSDNEGIIVNIAVGYGGRQEIVDAARDVVREEAEAGTPAEEIAEKISVESLARHLYTSGQPDPDLVIRTSGEQRLSGFLLWQAAYSEIWFTDTYWPAFRRIDYLRALRDYSQRNRRFGR
ncbi:isoprenyl transferase [Corynebacterium yudongzhengii]|uniref:Isoprenyl transferase n=1 Tax=Corynebacterium yudongzhengii TaxID=2080740 RepID=A0A2U1T6P8_9CORY|nr:isoprenyl transferase [Corynebacterium yudongzhengii]AWB82228.1 isoprenyl transferase [Corynebacterium yudongzhengii]PWC01677.1 isoprenyl transferase [Corynebacterium yudongzhengii]